MVFARTESPEATVERMRKPGKRMPVARMKFRQHPIQGLNIQRVDVNVFNYIRIIIPYKTIF